MPLQSSLDHHKDAPDLISVEVLALNDMVLPILLPLKLLDSAFQSYFALLVHQVACLLFAFCTVVFMPAAAMTVSGAAAMAPLATTLSSSSAGFGSSGVQRLAAFRSSARLSASRVVAVRASESSERPAMDLKGLINNVKELSGNISSSEEGEEGEEGKSSAVELAKRAAQRVATNAARDFASGDGDNKTNRLLDSVKELVGNISNLEGNQEGKNSAIDIARKAVQDTASNDSNGDTASNLLETVKSLSGKIPGFDGDNKEVLDKAKGAAQGAASNAARDFADNAKDRIGKEAGKLLDNITGKDNN